MASHNVHVDRHSNILSTHTHTHTHTQLTLTFCGTPLILTEQYTVLYAAGNNVPDDCTATFTTSNYHNQFAGSYIVNQSMMVAAARGDGSTVRTVGQPSVGRTKPSPEKIWAMHTPVSFSEVDTVSRPHPTVPGVTVLTTTYMSSAIPLASGQIAWT